MTAEECNDRAAECATNASLAVSELVSQEFMKLAGQWRAMAGRMIFLGHVDDPIASIMPLAIAPTSLI